jgi:hypothetical protein
MVTYLLNWALHMRHGRPPLIALHHTEYCVILKLGSLLCGYYITPHLLFIKLYREDGILREYAGWEHWFGRTTWTA